MNEQEKHDLLIKAAVKFGGKWPDVSEDQDCLIVSKQCGEIRASMINSKNIHEDLDKLRFDIVCTRSEFEFFVQELANKAPDGAEYYSDKKDRLTEGWYKKIDGVWFFCCAEISTIEWTTDCTQEPFKERELIPLPKRTEERPSIFIDGYLLPNRHDSEIGIEFEFQRDYEGVSYYKDDQGYILRVSKINPDEDSKVLNIPISQVEPAPWTPEVGQECEYYSHEMGESRKGLIHCEYQQGFIVIDDEDETPSIAYSHNLRPIRTEAEISRQALYDSLCELDADLDDYQINCLIEFIQGCEHD